ncbi:ABC transporter ATP-binding protein [Fusobacterium necrophorum]|uniref:ABC transporter ATP-binding protein n=1 Tax=Fusobacterium necrophorum TaxID=859 RepID=UPI00164DF0C4|nr:ABC transporter ATP-binding protein [Fusobacterium necrophorum]
MEVLMKIKNISVSVGKKKILKKLFFEIYQGESLGIIGESASGKTTLLHVLGEFLSANLFQVKGEIEYPKKKKPRSYMILQDAIHSLNPYEKIGKQLRETYSFHHKEEKKEKQSLEIHKILLSLGFENVETVLSSYPSALSGGMRQRIAIALILCCEVELLLADEPTTALDAVNQFRFVQLLQNICRERKITLVYVSHDIRILMQLCQRILVIKEGEIIEDSGREAIWEEPKHEYTKKLIYSVKSL